MTTPAVDASDRMFPVASARRTWHSLGVELRSTPIATALTVLWFLAASALGLTAPWLLGQMVDEVIGGASDTVLLRSTMTIAGAAIGAGAFTMLGGWSLARVGEGALARLRERVVDHAMHAPTAALERAGPGDLLTRVSDDVSVVTRALSSTAPTLVGAVFTIVLTGGGLFGLDWRLGLAGLISAPLYVLGLRWYLPRSGPLYASERVAMAHRSQALISSLQGQWTVRAYRREAAHLATIDERSELAMHRSVSAFGTFTGLVTWLNRAELLGLASLLTVGFMLVREDIVTVGATTSAALLFHRLFNPVGALVLTFDQVQSAGASLARLVGVADLPRAPEPEDTPCPTDTTLSFSGITHRYGAGPVVLEDVTFDVHPGERVALVGASGAGKSTLAAIAAGLVRPTRGTVRIGGLRYDSLGEHGIRQRIALVSQDVHVFSGPLVEDVRIGRPSATVDEVVQALRAVGAWTWVRALPAGLETIVGEPSHRLTAAQAQQVALARLQLVDPPVVLLDEATAEAGSAGSLALERAADVVTRGRTSLVIAHRLSQAVAADRVVVLDAGRVIEVGPHEHLVAAGGRYAELWAAWDTGPVPTS